MELIKENEEYLDILFSGNKKTSVSGDVIVPDVKPDVLKILQVDARSVIYDKGISSQGIYAEGKLYINILYIPDSENSTTCSINTEFDFKEKIDVAGVNSDMKLRMTSDVNRVEFNLLNSRKLSVKASVLLCYEIIGMKNIELVSGFDGDCGEFVTKTVMTDRIGAVEESEFIVRDTMEIPVGKQSVADIVKTDAKICNVESKAISGKLIAKGVLDICILYLTDDNKIDYCSSEFPFTEVFEAEDLDENDACSLDFEISDITSEISQDNDGDMRLINIECSAIASIRSHTKKEIKVIEDCYCPGMNTVIDCNEVPVRCFVDSITSQNSIKEIISPDPKLPPIAGIYNVICEPEIKKAYTDDKRVITEGNIRVYVLYISDNSKCSVYSFKYDIPISYSFDSENSQKGMDCSIKAEVDNTSFNINAAGEIELRCILSQQINVTQNENLNLITSVTTTPRTENNDIVIYFVKDGDNMWDIAKNYSVKMSDILAVNSLENESIKTGQKLLIPMCR